jgi:uncharacterized protein
MNDQDMANLLDEITRRIREVSDPEQIILFGSRARGDFGPDSDIDILVVKAGVDSPRQESVRLRRVLRGLPMPIDVFVATPQHIQQYGNIIGMIYRPAVREGKVLYARSPGT